MENACPEHAAAVDWLNSNMSDKGFFLIELKLIRIGDSVSAPVFNIVQKPNEYRIAMNSPNTNKSFQFQYWEEFVENTKDDKKFLNEYPGTDSRGSTTDGYYILRKGCRGNYYIVLQIYSRREHLNSLSVQVWILNDKDLYKRFEDHREEIQNELGFELEWDPKEGRNASNIGITRDISLGESFGSTHKWLREKAVVMRNVFNKYS